MGTEAQVIYPEITNNKYGVLIKYEQEYNVWHSDKLESIVLQVLLC